MQNNHKSKIKLFFFKRRPAEREKERNEKIKKIIKMEGKRWKGW